MAYTHLTMDEVGWIEKHYEIGYNGGQIADKLGRSNQPIYNVLTFFKEGGTAITYFKRYKENKAKCGAKKKTYTAKQIQYIKERVVMVGHRMSSLVAVKKTWDARCVHFTGVLKTAHSLISRPYQCKENVNQMVIKKIVGNKEINEVLTIVRKLILHLKMNSAI